MDTPREVEIPRKAWDVLLERLQAVPSTDGLVEKVGRLSAGRPIDLTGEEEAILHKVMRDWEHEVGSANVPSSIRELRDALRNYVLVYSRGEVEIQWDSRNFLLDRLRGEAAAAAIVTEFERTGESHRLQFTDEQMAVLRDVVARWLDEVGVSRLPTGIVRLRGALEEHARDVRARDSRV